MNHVSLFAGVGGFELAAQRAGIEPVLSSEIDPACNRVLAARFPGTVKFGDVTTLGASEYGLSERPFLLTGGSPCQDFSIAGLRKGMAGERSGLFSHFVRLIDELDPRFAVWENVPGALTSKGGADFANVIGALVGSDVPLPLPRHPSGRLSRYAGVAHGPAGTLAWRVLDAQHFGVAQRRQRVFAVLDRDGWASIPAVFPGYDDFRMIGHGSVPKVLRGSSWACPIDAVALPFGTGMAPPEPTKVRLAGVLESDVDERYYLSEKACLGILSRATRRGKTLPPVLDYALRVQAGVDPGEHPNDDPIADLAACVTTGTGRRYDAETETLVPVLVKNREGKDGGGKGPLLSPDLSLTLATGNDQVLFEPMSLSQNSRDEVRLSPIAPCLSGGGGKPGQGYPTVVHAVNARQDPVHALDMTAGALDTDGGTHAIAVPPLYRVRRLTPNECERLQGFPDGWTDVPGAKDSHRYKQMGNAVAVPVASWVVDRIVQVAGERPTPMEVAV